MKNRFHLIALLALPVSTVVFMASPTLLIAAIMRISDRGLSYSINRASKELLYVPIDPLLIYQAKAWIPVRPAAAPASPSCPASATERRRGARP